MSASLRRRSACRSGLFIASPTFTPEDLHVYINPVITLSRDQVIGEEGCLSFPQVYNKVPRAREVSVRAIGLDGEPFTQDVADFHARILQHETDHLEATLLVDRMGAVAKLQYRKALKRLEDEARK